MKVVLLAGGKGTRISEESTLKPKPMIEIGGMPILWHIMKLYSACGFNEFIICCGYKGYVIKEYFANYFLHTADVTFDLTDRNHMRVHSNNAEPWRVTLVDTGLETMTGGRIKRIKPYIAPGEQLMLTYGDGVADIDISKLYAFHQSHGLTATVTAVRPTARFGALEIQESGLVTRFKEKPKGDGSRVNGGFFVFNHDIFDYIEGGDEAVFESEPLEKLASARQLMSYNHDAFWQPMDTLREKNYLEELWASGTAPWKKW